MGGARSAWFTEVILAAVIWRRLLGDGGGWGMVLAGARQVRRGALRDTGALSYSLGP